MKQYGNTAYTGSISKRNSYASVRYFVVALLLLTPPTFALIFISATCHKMWRLVCLQHTPIQSYMQTLGLAGNGGKNVTAACSDNIVATTTKTTMAKKIPLRFTPVVREF